jgi:hypothetical protein
MVVTCTAPDRDGGLADRAEGGQQPAPALGLSGAQWSGAMTDGGRVTRVG